MVALRLEPQGEPLVIRFTSLDDFHPDQLYARLPIFQALRDLRARLNDSREFPAAAREMAGEAPPAPPKRAAGGLLDSILDEAAPPDTNAALAASGGDLHRFLQQVLKPHLIPRADPRQAELVAQVDAAASATLRAILHHPAVQALEALWRGADLLVRRVDTSTDLRIELIDLTEAELHASLPPGGDPEQSPLLQLLTRQSQTVPWALLAGDYTLGGHPADAERLAQLAAIGHLLQAPWIAGAHASLVGVTSLAQQPDAADWHPVADPAWDLVRSSPLARSVGLVLPRFLLRLPYGAGFDACESLAFEELEKEPAHAAYLWGPAAFAVALILGRAFADAGGWSLLGSVDPEIGGLPQVVRGRGADAVALPCAEILMTERGGARLLDRGLMPLASLKDQDRVRLLRLQSVAQPVAALAGRWS
jgi:type VI secretion system protein ImpC